MSQIATTTAETAAAVTAAFAAARTRAKSELGGVLYARQNFSCCGGCAVSELTTLIEAHNAKGKGKAVGCVYYHRQDADRFRYGFDLCIGYSGTAGIEDGGVSTVKVGKLLADCLRAEGLTVEWSGKPTDRITVKVLRQTFETVRWDTLGDAATPDDLPRYAEAVRVAAEADPRVSAFTCEIAPSYFNGEPFMRLSVTGIVTAKELTDAVFEKGGW